MVVPTFVVDEGHAASEYLDLLDPCAAKVARVTFDATVFPIFALSFTARRDGIALEVDMNVPDRDVPGQVEPLNVTRTLLMPWVVLRANGPDYLVRWMRETIANILAHEVDESIALDGIRIFDPHRPLDEMVRAGGAS